MSGLVNKSRSDQKNKSTGDEKKGGSEKGHEQKAEAEVVAGAVGSGGGPPAPGFRWGKQAESHEGALLTEESLRLHEKTASDKAAADAEIERLRLQVEAEKGEGEEGESEGQEEDGDEFDEAGSLESFMGPVGQLKAFKPPESIASDLGGGRLAALAMAEASRYRGFDRGPIVIKMADPETRTKAISLYLTLGGGFNEKKLSRRAKSVSEFLTKYKIFSNMASAGSAQDPLTLSRIAAAFPRDVMRIRNALLRSQHEVRTYGKTGAQSVIADPSLASFTKRFAPSLAEDVAKAHAELFKTDVDKAIEILGTIPVMDEAEYTKTKELYKRLTADMRRE